LSQQIGRHVGIVFGDERIAGRRIVAAFVAHLRAHAGLRALRPLLAGVPHLQDDRFRSRLTARPHLPRARSC
jgi:hypothetical protein